MDRAIVVPDEVDASFTGELIDPGDPGYEQARRVHNGLIDKRSRAHRPLPHGPRRHRRRSESAAAGRHRGVRARRRPRRRRLAVTDGGLMIDLAPMKGIKVDPAGRRVWAQGGVTWNELNRAAAGPRAGHHRRGGLHHRDRRADPRRRRGLADGQVRPHRSTTCWRSRSSRPTGEVLYGQRGAEPDLFWALRGGGGNFGVVTAFEYRAHPVSDGAAAAWSPTPSTGPGDAVAFYRDLTPVGTRRADHRVLRPVRRPGRPEAKLAAMIACHCGDPAAAEARPETAARRSGRRAAT